VGGAAVFRFGVAGSAGRDAVETRLDVRPDFHPRAHTVVGVVRDAASVELRLPADIDPARSRLRLRVGTSPLVPMLAAYERLRVYPYYCTEQISSGGRALVAIYRAVGGTRRATAVLGANPVGRLQQLADELMLRQREDGAIGFWRSTDWSSAWLSSYAGLFLLDARAVGVVVEQRVIDRLAQYLGAAAADSLPRRGMNPSERIERRLALGERVAAVVFLRRAGRASQAAEDRLLARTADMVWEDRLRLAAVLSRRSDVVPRVRALLDEAWRGITVAGGRVDLPDTALTRRDFPSRIRPAARLLTATLAIRPDHALIGALIETVLQQGRAERYWAWNTQDYASVVTALAQFGSGAAAESGRRVTVVAGSRTLLDRVAWPYAADVYGGGDVQVADSVVPLTNLVHRDRDGTITLPLRLVASEPGDGIFYALTVDEVPARPPVTPDVQGITVERWYERFDDGKPVTSVEEGALVRVRLRVTVPADRHFVVVDDALPAGLEPVDLSLRTSATLGPFVSSESEATRRRGDRDRDGPRWQSWLYGSWDNGWWSPWDHKELRDDRVVYFARALWKGTYTASYVARATTRGTFVRPPAHAEEMYNPGVHGRSDGGRFVVTAR
jgi:alpha-2-macroglobulin